MHLHEVRHGLPIALLMGALSLGCAVATASGQALRIENETKLTVPVDLTESVWDYLQQRYGNVKEILDPLGGDFRASFAEDRHLDQYFDTPRWLLLRTQGGIRHRARFIISGEDTTKDGRELIQIKLDRPGDLEVNRTEIKFPVRDSKRIRRLEDAHPLIGLVRPDRREEFRHVLAGLGIDARELRPTLLLEQRRRRVYISRDGVPFATITLDQVSTGQWWRSVSYAELEIELNEKAYTEADPAARDEMQTFTDAMDRDVRSAFPAIVQDQTPKYNKAFTALSGKFLWFPAAFRLGMPFEALFTAAGLALAVGIRVWAVRRRGLCGPAAGAIS